MKAKRSPSTSIIIILAMITIIIANFNISRINRLNGYYTGKIESMNKKDGIITMEISPISSKRTFIHEIEGKHVLEYKESIGISGISDPKTKKSRKVKLGELGELVDNLKVGDTIIFKVENYDKADYKLRIMEIAFDLTID